MKMKTLFATALMGLLAVGSTDALKAETAKTHEIVWQVDSVTSTYYDPLKYAYTYDTAGNMTQHIAYNWNTDKWVENYKKEYTYDTAGNMTQYIYYKWNSGIWVESQKYDYAYNTAGNQTQYISYNWNSGIWVERQKYDYAYDTAGNKTQSISYKWDTDKWVETYKSDFTYDTAGNQTQSITYRWNSGIWVESYRCDYAYDAAGNMTQEIDYTWNSGIWVESMKYDFTYDTAGNKTQHIYSTWNTDKWVEWSKDEKAYSPAYLKVTVPNAGLFTIYADKNMITPYGYVYAMQYDDTYDALTISNIAKTGQVLPANQGYVFEALDAGTYAFVFTDEEAMPDFASCLKGVTEETATATVKGAGTIYTLATGGNGIGLYTYTGTNLAPYKAYYLVSAPLTKSFIGLQGFTGDGTTGINFFKLKNNLEDKAIYNLEGQRMGSLKKGINIVGGKKILVK